MSEPVPNAEGPVISMSGVDVRALRDQHSLVVKDVNWTVNRGDFWVVAGLQGAGKTDLLVMTGGLMPPGGGVYKLFGELMPIFDEARLPHRLRMGLAFDGGQLFNHLTIAENVALPLRYHRDLPLADARAEIQPLLEALQLAEWADSTPGAVGRNWQKRVGLARALALRPELLLIDSPLTGLDLRHTQWWLRFLEQLYEGHPLAGGRPMILVVTSADLEPWRRLGRQFALLRDQRFLSLGNWDAVTTSKEELLREVIATMPQHE